MKSEIIQVDNLGNGFKKVEEITLQYAGFGSTMRIAVEAVSSTQPTIS